MSKKSKMVLLSLAVMLVMSIAVVGCDETTEPAPEAQEEPIGDTDAAMEDPAGNTDAVMEEPVADTDAAVEEPAELETLSPVEGDFVAGTSITFRWEATESAENYRIRIIRQSDGTVFYNRITESTESSYTVSNFSDDGEIYCWQVAVLNDEGWSDWSETNCFTNSEPWQ